MDYDATLHNDYIHKAMYPDDPMRVDWIPKGPPTGTLTIKPKDRCSPRFVTKIEGSAVEESCKVFFEGIVDAQPQPKFSWYFNDEPIVPGIYFLFSWPSQLGRVKFLGHLQIYNFVQIHQKSTYKQI